MNTATKVAIPSAALFTLSALLLGGLKYVALPHPSTWEWDCDPDEF